MLPVLVRRLVVPAAVGGLFLLVGCGEHPDANASRPPAPSAPPAGGSPDGSRQSTLGRSLDFAERVIEDAKEADQERMDIIDEMNGVERSSGDPDDPAG